MVDRCSNYTWGLIIPSKDKETVKRGIVEKLSELPEGIVKTITFDNGKDFVCYKELEEILQCKIYFADSYLAWQRGINENINRMYRYYLPKKKSFAHLTDEKIDDISEQMVSVHVSLKVWK